MNKKRLLYISSEFFIDVDISLLKELENYFFVDWFLLLQKKSFYYDVNIIQNYSKNYNININILVNQNRYRSIKTFWFYCKVFWKAHKIKADIIYIETLGYPYLPLVSYFLIPLNKVVFGIHDYIFLLGEKNRNVKMFFSKVVFNIYKNFHFFSESQEKHFLTSFPNKNTFNTPLSLKDFGQPENKFAFNLDSAKINVLFFGSIKEYKGLDILLEEFNMLEENVRNKLHITIWGQCEDFTIYKNLIKYPNNFTIKTTSVPNEVIPYSTRFNSSSI